MRYKKAVIDSLNLKAYNISRVIDNKDYNLFYFDKDSKSDQHEWKKCFGRWIPKNVSDAKILYPLTGGAIPIKTYCRDGVVFYVIEFAGLHGYNQRADEVNMALRGLESQLLDYLLSRVDVAIDYERLPSSIIKCLYKNRIPLTLIDKDGNKTTYFKTEKEKKTNTYMNILIYDKQIGNKTIKRLEICFKNPYFKEEKLVDFEAVKKRMEKSIKKVAGVDVKIHNLLNIYGS